MLELHRDRLVFSFPELHKHAKISVEFQRTLRIPDDGKQYPLPPGLGTFPLRHIDDYATRLPATWVVRGGVMLPMHAAEALWILFNGSDIDGDSYPFAIKVAAGKINAVTGEAWSPGINRDPQDYLVHPDQPWLDGYCVDKGQIRQFVAMPLGQGYTVEEQLTHAAEFGGLQIMVAPMKVEYYRKLARRFHRSRYAVMADACFAAAAPRAMGLSAGGRMRQHIYNDPHSLDAWDLRHTSRCFIHLVHAHDWPTLTGQPAPTTPPTAADYTNAGLPWFDFNHPTPGMTPGITPAIPAVPGAKPLQHITSIADLGKQKAQSPLPENQSTTPVTVIPLTPTQHRPIREMPIS